MPQLEYFLVAESVSVDQSTNRLSVFNILEEVHLQRVPVPEGMTLPAHADGIPQLTAVSSWNMTDQDRGNRFQVELRLVAPGLQDPIRFVPLAFTAERDRQRTLQVIVGCPVGTPPGELLFQLYLNDKYQASHRITALLDDESVAWTESQGVVLPAGSTLDKPIIPPPSGVLFRLPGDSKVSHSASEED
ncbi:MAG TPA: hypothetical protein VK395_11415 [Gemmataceae bacterium]|nr:hypothetical protein [Gemmataceae bacterium]